MHNEVMDRTRIWGTHKHTDRVNSKCPSAILWQGHKKGDNIRDFLSASLDEEAFPKWNGMDQSGLNFPIGRECVGRGQLQ